MNFQDLSTYIKFGSGLLGLITGSVATAGILRQIFKSKQKADQDVIAALEKLVKAKSDQVEILESERLGLAHVALEKYDKEMRDGNDERAVIALEEWFATQRDGIGTIGQRLAEHYISYSEPETLHDALIKAQRGATLASLCVESSRDVNDLLNEISILLDEAPSIVREKDFERALDVAEDFAGPNLIQEVIERVVSAIHASNRLRERGHFWTALHVIQRARRLAERRLPVAHEVALLAGNQLVVSLYAVGFYSKAEPIARGVLAIREKVLGAEHPDMAMSLNNVAEQLRAQGDYAGAKPLFERALAISEKAFGAEHPNTAASLNNIAGLFLLQGDYAGAKPLFERALAISEKARGAEHPDTAMSLNNLAGLLRAQEDYAGAKPLYERALAISEKVLGAEHPDTATRLDNFAELLCAQGDYARAKPLFERALAISEKALGAEHPNTATSLNNLAGLLRAQGDYARAKPLYERALAISEKALGAEHPDTKLIRKNVRDLNEAASPERPDA